MSTYFLANSSRLRPFPCGKAIGLSFHGRCFRRCECGIYAVEAREDSVISWHCKGCGKPRLTQRRKSDQELIAELLGNPNLRGWDKLFTETLSKAGKLAPWQQEKIQGIAEKLGIGLEYNCSLSEVEGGAR